MVRLETTTIDNLAPADRIGNTLSVMYEALSSGNLDSEPAMTCESNQLDRDHDYSFLSFPHSRCESVTAASQLSCEVSHASREIQSP